MTKPVGSNGKIQTAYHYTSFENWRQIKRDGFLKVYPITNESITAVLGPLEGIYVYPRCPDGISHIGSLMYQMYSKETTRVVRLEVTYTQEDLIATKKEVDCVSLNHTLGLKCGDCFDSRKIIKKVELYNNGDIGGFVYDDSTPVLLLGQDVPLENIRFMRTYDLKKLLA